MTDLGSSIIICLGANLPSFVGFPDQTLHKAVSQLAQMRFSVTGVSRFFGTPSFPKGIGPDYVNAALTARTDLPPEAILSALHDIERRFGRNRDTRWGQRTLDLDLIAVEDRIAPDVATFDQWRALPLDDQKLAAPDRLILPHPRLQDRAFVLIPMADLVPDWRHPVLGQTVRQMIRALPAADCAAIRAL